MTDDRSRRSSRPLLDPPHLLKRTKLSQPSDAKSTSQVSSTDTTVESPAPRYAHLSYAPATKTTVVTTTTTTTTSFPAFLVDSPRDLQSRDPRQYPLASVPTPSNLTQFSFEAGGRTALFQESGITEAARPKTSKQAPSPPVSNTRDLTRLQSITSNPSESKEPILFNPISNPRKRPASPTPEITPQALQNQSFAGIPKKTRHRLRGLNNAPLTPRSRTITRSRRYISNDSSTTPQKSPVSLAEDAADTVSQPDDSATDDDAAPDTASSNMPPSPPSFISVAPEATNVNGVATPPIGDQEFEAFEQLARHSESTARSREMSPQAAQDNSLPSPMLSPVIALASPVLDTGRFDGEQPLPEQALLPLCGHESKSVDDCAPSVVDNSNTPLADLFRLVDTFDSYPIELQRYAMYQLLRRSNKKLLQFTADLVNPALKCDFLARLPTELSLHIIQHLDAKTLCRVAQVSRRWRELADSYDQVWKELVEGEGFTIPNGEVERAICEGWKWQGVMPAEKDLSTQLLRLVSNTTPPTIAEASARTAATLKRGAKRSAETMEGNKKRRRMMGRTIGYSARSGDIRNSMSLQVDLQALTANLPELGLKSLRIPHLYKSIYRRHHGFRNSWMRPETKPHHIAFQAHGRHVVTCLQFDNDKILTGSDDTRINVWDSSSGAGRKELLGHEGGVWALQYDGNTLVSGSTDRTVRIWDIEKGRCQHVFQGHTSTVRCLVILKPVVVGHNTDGTPIMMPKEPLIITGSRDSTLRVWKLPNSGDTPFNSKGDVTIPDTANPYYIRTLHGHIHSVRAIAAHGDTLVSGSYDSTVRVWRISSGDLIHRLAGHSQKVYSVILDHERNRCISGSMDNMVKVWSLESGQCIFNLEGHTSLVGLLDLNHDRLVSAAADWSLKIWDPETGHCRKTLEGHTGAITCFQHDGMKVVSGSDRSLKLWDIKTGKLVRDLLSDLSGGWQVRFNDRKCVAAVQRNNRTYIEVLDFGAARDGVPEAKLGLRTLVDEYGQEVTDVSDDEVLEE